MRTLEQVIDSLPPAERAKVLARGREIIAEEKDRQMAVAQRIMRKQHNALRELANDGVRSTSEFSSITKLK
jgi:acyl-CoA reductase-like NAD-dependent aldehyde dehydrogenase